MAEKRTKADQLQRSIARTDRRMEVRPDEILPREEQDTAPAKAISPATRRHADDGHKEAA